MNNRKKAQVKHKEEGYILPALPCTVPDCPDKYDKEKCDYKSPKDCALYRAIIVRGLPIEK